LADHLDLKSGMLGVRISPVLLGGSMFKFNGGKGAIVCDQCKTIIMEYVKDTKENQKKILCKKCKAQ
tara:strand:+ start:289 stop:489 length:201 start_codon:yes stop_codon:yes gene_type:complete